MRPLSPLDAAAKAWFDRDQAKRLFVRAEARRSDGQPWQWDDITEDDRNAYRALVRPSVKAALDARREAHCD